MQRIDRMADELPPLPAKTVVAAISDPAFYYPLTFTIIAYSLAYLFVVRYFEKHLSTDRQHDAKGSTIKQHPDLDSSVAIEFCAAFVGFLVADMIVGTLEYRNSSIRSRAGSTIWVTRPSSWALCSSVCQADSSLLRRCSNFRPSRYLWETSTAGGSGIIPLEFSSPFPLHLYWFRGWVNQMRKKAGSRNSSPVREKIESHSKASAVPLPASDVLRSRIPAVDPSVGE
ncbi:hypothetical protein BJ742DRAFT_741921 [Cladochytrium replicatum]|nr:hypothetical protein BJ742DRAFT_741921 [Cladochytrium replicatum]